MTATVKGDGPPPALHPSHFAVATPDKPALIMAGTGQVVTFAELEAASNRAAHLLRSLGLKPGDAVAVCLGNRPEYFTLAWAAQRSGLYFVALSSRLTLAEIDYIARDSGAGVLIADADLPHTPDLPRGLSDLTLFCLGGATPGYRVWEDEAALQPVTRIADEVAGGEMLYSSGTTGRPKGVRPELPRDGTITAMPMTTVVARSRFGVDADSVYLCPAPLYHAAPLRWSMAVQHLGGTVVLMEKFDPERALAAVDRHRVTHSQWVPTHFIRMLKLPDEVRARYDVSSLKLAIHASAPCPVPVKQAMIDWFGPILVEYYAGTEGNGMTIINSQEWLRKPGSVGRANFCVVHILDDEGRELPPGEVGNIYFQGDHPFEYHNDPEKTAGAYDARGWTTLGDVGRLDEDGYLFLTDRKSFMIISGGVNIYPQEIENLLIQHPRVADVAVIGAPCPEMGERVVAVIQPADWADATPEVAAELSAWARRSLSGIKLPRQFDFMRELPRHDTGKLYKRLIRDEYWKDAGS